MKRTILSLVGAALVVGPCHAQPLGDDKLADQKTTAQAMVTALVKEDFTAAGKAFDDTMKKVLPTDKLEQTWKKVIGQVGAFQKQTGVRTESGGKYDLVFVTCQFEKTTLDIKVSFNADKQIAGLFFVAPKGTYDFKPPAYAKPDSFRESDVTVGAGEWALPGTLTLPKGDGPFAAVVLVQGSGPHDRDETIGPNKPLRDLAWGLASQGIAVLRYEKRTKEHGVKMVAQKDYPTIKEEVIDDALAAVALLRKNPAIDSKRIFVIGHSLGALVAPRIGEQDPAIAGLILLAGNSRPLEDVVLEQFIYLYSLDSASADKHQDDLDKLKKQIARVKDPKLSAETPAEELPLNVPGRYWLSLRDYDAPGTAAKIKQPMLILQGERDYQVTMADFEGWKKALASRGNVRFKSYPNLNHLFMEGEGKAKPAEYDQTGHVDQNVVTDIAEWVKKP
jgi:dienelactone hydrolase